MKYMVNNISEGGRLSQFTKFIRSIHNYSYYFINNTRLIRNLLKAT